MVFNGICLHVSIENVWYSFVDVFLKQMVLYCAYSVIIFLTEPNTLEIFPRQTHRPVFSSTAAEWCSIVRGV